eukprot:jgi/Chlat1/6785/Chrsp51S06486
MWGMLYLDMGGNTTITPPPTHPLAAETHGTLGQSFHDVIETCARRALAARDLPLRRLSGYLALYRQRVSCALQRAQGITILERGAAVVAAVPGLGPVQTAAPTAEADAVLAAAAV